jgi:hypothetical protein
MIWPILTGKETEAHKVKNCCPKTPRDTGRPGRARVGAHSSLPGPAPDAPPHPGPAQARSAPGASRPPVPQPGRAQPIAGSRRRCARPRPQPSRPPAPARRSLILPPLSADSVRTAAPRVARAAVPPCGPGRGAREGCGDPGTVAGCVWGAARSSTVGGRGVELLRCPRTAGFTESPNLERVGSPHLARRTGLGPAWGRLTLKLGPV